MGREAAGIALIRGQSPARKEFLAKMTPEKRAAAIAIEQRLSDSMEEEYAST